MVTRKSADKAIVALLAERFEMYSKWLVLTLMVGLFGFAFSRCGGGPTVDIDTLVPTWEAEAAMTLQANPPATKTPLPTPVIPESENKKLCGLPVLGEVYSYGVFISYVVEITEYGYKVTATTNDGWQVVELYSDHAVVYGKFSDTADHIKYAPLQEEIQIIWIDQIQVTFNITQLEIVGPNVDCGFDA